MALDTRYITKHKSLLRDVRPLWQRYWQDYLTTRDMSVSVFAAAAICLLVTDMFVVYADVLFAILSFYFFLLFKSDRTLVFCHPKYSKFKDNNGKDGKGQGIMYLGNEEKTGQEAWFSNDQARTHMLYLGTTGSGKTVGLTSTVSNAMCWASGFVFIDGKADTDLWSNLSSLVRRFGRDDDLFVLNYMTGNSDKRAPSNSMNPFSSGSASYLTNMLVSLMPEAEGDNAMWKERAVSLVSSLMPALTWKRDNQDIPLSVGTIRNYMALNNVVKLSRDEVLPQKIRESIKGYLETLPGYNDNAFDDEGREKPPGPGQPMIDTTTARQQHGYLTMQFTRSLQSLGDDYGYIFDTQAADVDMLDVVLNRRILIVLIPALEKSADETANLGKIVAATLKGMMGSTLGSTVEGESSTVIENKPTNSATPFMTVFDEVGYYTAAGMAVMAAQARSLGFCLIYAAQDLPALEKRVKEEARSITANCNIKIFGKLEDPTQTKEFFDKTVGSSFVTEVSSFTTQPGSIHHTYYDSYQASVQLRGNASYDALKGFKSGQSVMCFGDAVRDVKIFYANPGHAKAMRVTRYMALPPPSEQMLKYSKQVTKLRDMLVKKGWSADKADVNVETPKEIRALVDAYSLGIDMGADTLVAGTVALAGVYGLNNKIDLADTTPTALEKPAAQAATPPAPAATPAAKPATATAPTVTTQEPAQQAKAAVLPPKRRVLDGGAAAAIRDAAVRARAQIFRGKKKQGGDNIDAAE
ncbi:MAG: TraM recognition domain-containing protein [Alphaproteobacteria bacterium]|nr:TraM recognition domain-containing protein [Alphaproteobacteria bacterium]